MIEVFFDECLVPLEWERRKLKKPPALVFLPITVGQECIPLVDVRSSFGSIVEFALCLALNAVRAYSAFQLNSLFLGNRRTFLPRDRELDLTGQQWIQMICLTASQNNHLDVNALMLCHTMDTE